MTLRHISEGGSIYGRRCEEQVRSVVGPIRNTETCGCCAVSQTGDIRRKAYMNFSSRPTFM
jgi:hypothetical protein